MKTEKKKSFLRSLSWVLFVSRRFSRVDRKGRSKVTTFLASLGICFGVMTLITVISVMNGFQMSFIDSILEISSYHARVSDVPGDRAADFAIWAKENPDIKACVPFYEAQSLLVGKSGRESAAVIRALPKNIYETDSGFADEAVVWTGNYDVESENSIVLGSDLAKALKVRPGMEVTLFALSGGNDVDLISSDRVFTVRGLFHSGYAEINSSYAFVSLESGLKYFGSEAKLNYGLKVKRLNEVSKVVRQVEKAFPDLNCESWENFNKSFFGALRVEKNLLMLLVFLIFVVVAINIFNGMRRMVYERRSEISVLSAFGGQHNMIQSIFILQGFLIGFEGAIPGLAFGLLLSVKMGTVFMILSKALFYVQYFFCMLFAPQTAAYVTENPMYMIYSKIPPRIVPSEVLLITVFGIFSALLASYTASRSVLKMKVAEVMRDE